MRTMGTLGDPRVKFCGSRPIGIEIEKTTAVAVVAVVAAAAAVAIPEVPALVLALGAVVEAVVVAVVAAEAAVVAVAGSWAGTLDRARTKCVAAARETPRAHFLLLLVLVVPFPSEEPDALFPVLSSPSVPSLVRVRRLLLLLLVHLDPLWKPVVVV